MINTNMRQKYNLEILKKLQDFIEKHPEYRFHQALWAAGLVTRDKDLNIIDKFYEESEVTFDKLKI